MKEMRRKKQALNKEEMLHVLRHNTSGVLALSDGIDYPYALPISYVFDEDKLYFHCAKSGQKLAFIEKNQKTSFCIIDQDHIVPDEYTSYFRSVIVFGTMQIIEQGEERVKALYKLAEKYSPKRSHEQHRQEIDRFLDSVCILCLHIEHMTGKEAIELRQKRQA